MADAVLCPRCCKFKATTITLSHKERGIVYQGCSDCLIGELDVLSSFRAPQCSTCGTTKVSVIFDNGAKRLECPGHVRSRGLLGSALKFLETPGDVAAAALKTNIGDVLGIKI